MSTTVSCLCPPAYMQALFDVARVLRRTTPTDPYEDEYYAVQTVEDEVGGAGLPIN